MAIWYGVPVPKGKTRKQLKARKDREDAKLLKRFRDDVWAREATCDPIFGWANCEHCGAHVSREPVMTGEVHHRISRRHKATRYDPDNGVLLCNHLVNGCHERAERGEIEV
jgi:HNH endonuclease